MSNLVPVLRKGEFPHSRGFVQVVDDAAMQAILEQEIPPEGLLFDFDHYSDLTNREREKLREMGMQLPSDASGWIHGFHMGDDGDTLYATVDCTEAGENAVKSGVYKYPSPVFPVSQLERLDGNRVRPHAISKVALTNEPNIKAIGTVLANRAEGDAEDGIVVGEVYATALDADTEHNEQEKQMKEKLARALGLAMDVSEDAVMQAVFALQSAKADGERKAAEVSKALSDLKNRVEEQDKELTALREEKAKAELDAKVTAELAKYPSLANREAAETLLRANFDAGAAFLATIPAPSKAQENAKGMKPGEGLANRETSETPAERLARVRKAEFTHLKK